MKIQCDVCNFNGASVFCLADEAALCDSCDHRVHLANKLASKHQRFSLVNPDKKEAPVCDICKEKRAYLFCQQDRAILCKDCDLTIHTTNQHKQSHNRFLLTGVKLSAYVSSSASASLAATSSETSLTGSCDLVSDFKCQASNKKSDTASNQSLNPQSSAVHRIVSPTSSRVNNKSVALRNDVGISEYLIEMLPGWHVEDLLDSTPIPYSFPKDDDCMMPFSDADFYSNISSFSAENPAIWVPNAPQPPKQASLFSPHHLTANINFKEATNMKTNRRWVDEGFTVPQISPQPAKNTSSKRSRSFW